MKKIFAILLTLALVFSLAACGANDDNTTTATETTTEEVVTEEASTTEATEPSTDESKPEGRAAEESSTEAEESTEEETEKEKAPSTKEEIVAAYAAVMNQAKKDAPGFKKVEWQTLPDDANSRIVAQGESVVNTALNLAGNNFMTTKEKSTSNPEIKDKGNDMSIFPISNSDYGCLLKDASAVKTATCTVLPNGNYKIKIVLKDEKNPEPIKNKTDKVAPSNHGSVFSPVSKKEIDDTLNGGIVSAVAKDITYSLTYHDCSSTIEFNPKDNKLVSLEQFTKVTISGSGRIAFITLDVTKQELVDEMHITDFKY